MSRIIDLSMPNEDPFRWPVERQVRGRGGEQDLTFGIPCYSSVCCQGE